MFETMARLVVPTGLVTCVLLLLWAQSRRNDFWRDMKARLHGQRYQSQLTLFWLILALIGVCLTVVLYVVSRNK